MEGTPNHRAARRVGRRDLADALERLAASLALRTPASALAAGRTGLELQITRLRREPRPTPLAVRVTLGQSLSGTA